MSEFEYDENNNITKQDIYDIHYDGELYLAQTFVYENTYYE